MSTSADTVLFAIQAGLKLYGGLRKAYVDSTRARALVLPLPRAAGTTATAARDWLRSADGKRAAAGNERVLWLLDRFEQGQSTPDEQRELIRIFTVLWDEMFPAQAKDPEHESALTGAELLALLTVRNWTRNESGAPRSPLQQVAGTLVNIAVDYYAQTPNAVSDKRPEGRLLLSFLRAVDEVDFANAASREIVGDVLIGVLDGIAAHPGAFGGGDFEQQLIANVAKSLSGSAKQFVAPDAAATELASAGAWLQLVARAVVAGGAQTVLSNPVRFLGVKEGGETALVQAVGSTLAELLLADEHKLTFRNLLSGDGVTKVAQAALQAIAENPELLKVDHQGLKAILVAVAGDLAKYDAPFAADFFPELTRLILEKTAYNLDLVWGPKFKSPDRHLLVTASRSLLRSLAKKPKPGATWRPVLTQKQVLLAVDTVFEEVLQNPDWLVARAADQDDALGAAVDAMLAAMRNFDGNRVSADAGVAMFRAGILAVGLRIELLDQLPAGGQDAGKAALTAVVDVVLDAVLGQRDKLETNWRLARNETLQVLVEVALEEIAKRRAGQAQIDVLRGVLGDLAAGEFDVPAFRDQLANALAA